MRDKNIILDIDINKGERRFIIVPKNKSILYKGKAKHAEKDFDDILAINQEKCSGDSLKEELEAFGGEDE